MKRAQTFAARRDCHTNVTGEAARTDGEVDSEVVKAGEVVSEVADAKDTGSAFWFFIKMLRATSAAATICLQKLQRSDHVMEEAADIDCETEGESEANYEVNLEVMHAICEVTGEAWKTGHEKTSCLSITNELRTVQKVSRLLLENCDAEKPKEKSTDNLRLGQSLPPPIEKPRRL